MNDKALELARNIVDDTENTLDDEESLVVCRALLAAHETIDRVKLTETDLASLRHIRLCYPNATGMHHDEGPAAMALLDRLIGTAR